MMSTSLKLDRELFRGQLNVLPERPDPRLQSPYYDARQYADVDLSQPQFAIVAPLLRELARAYSAQPSAVNSEQLPQILVAGLYRRLQRAAPAAIWEGAAGELLAFARNELTANRISEIAADAWRELGIGPLQVRSNDLQDQGLAADVAPVDRWRIATPATATLRPAIDNTLPIAAVSYDFSGNDRFILENEFELDFPAAELHRVQLRLRPDDTWHDLHFIFEAAGVRYSAERPAWLLDTRWTTVSWQKPSSDDDSTKLKTWLILKPTEWGPQFDHGVNRIKVQLEFRQRSPLEASFSKARYNFQRVADQVPFWRYVRVSVLLVLLNIVLTLVSSSLVAYAFARIQWPGRDVAFLIMLGTMMIPGQVTMIPNFLIWKTVGGYNTLTPLWAGAALGNAFFIFLMRQFLKGVPPDLEDAARIDGCGFLRIWWHVMLPLTKPCLAAIAIFTFIGTWNDFLGPLIYIADQRLYPLAFGLYAFSVQVEGNPVLTMAASLLMTIPVIVVFFLTQRWFVQGITLTGMKG
jgi:ABC-type glycerol-3-phosphate transport system permease component